MSYKNLLGSCSVIHIILYKLPHIYIVMTYKYGNIYMYTYVNAGYKQYIFINGSKLILWRFS